MILGKTTVHVTYKIKVDIKVIIFSQAYWHMSVIPAHRRMRQGAHKFQTNLGYIRKPCLKKLKNNK
jgi:hypothetical protein